MNDIVPCTGCADCGIGYATGFTGGRVMRCMKMDTDTTAIDGCTHGTPGEPSPIAWSWAVYLAGHEAVMGWHERG